MVERSKHRVNLAKHILGKGFTSDIIYRLAWQRMQMMTEPQKEKLAVEVFELIQNCDTEEEAVRMLEEQGIIREDR